MGDLVSEIENLYQDCTEYLNLLNEINSVNFDEKISILKNKSKLIESKKNHLNKSFDISELKKVNIKFDPLIKQINERFDSILKIIKLEQKQVSSKLKEEFNKKKLANYR